MNFRYVNRVLHRDLGFLFFGMTIIYAVSGIALNHIRDFNPNYIINKKNITVDVNLLSKSNLTDNMTEILNQSGIDSKVKSFYFPDSNTLRVFLKNGNMTLDTMTGEGYWETIQKRPVLFELNLMHYNPRLLWTIFSDIFAVSLLIISITGLFIIKGKKGITGRGAVLTGIGVLLPLILFFFYL